MAKRGKSLSQHAVGVMTLGLPIPFKSFITSRYGAPITLAVFLALGGAGVLQLEWENGRPKLSVDQERADELKDDLNDLKDDAAEYAAEMRSERGEESDLLDRVAGDDSPFSIPWGNSADTDDSFATEVAEKILPEKKPTFELPPIANPEDGGFKGPLANLRERFRRKE